MKTISNTPSTTFPFTESREGKTPLILTINGGSSSIKCAAFSAAAVPIRQFRAQIERIGSSEARLTIDVDKPSESETRPIAGGNFEECVRCLVDYLRQRLGASPIVGIGHRIVHGGLHLLEHQRVTPDLIGALRQAQELDLAHLPHEIALIECFAEAFPSVAQFACFDTAFHRDLPHVGQLLPIPRRYLDSGVRRFGFHGLSYTSLMRQLSEQAGPTAANGRIVMAHLGSGASMAAVRGGKPIDTTMSFTPASGLVMGTRPGDMDPGLLLYLMNEQNVSPHEMEPFISERCGLLGVSGISADMRDLLARRATDPRAADAVDLFCYQAKKFLGAMAAALGGMDTLIFSGGIGEHSPEVRWEICDGMEDFGIGIDRQSNTAGNEIISNADSRVTVRVIATDEEQVIAETVQALTATQVENHPGDQKSGGSRGS